MKSPIALLGSLFDDLKRLNPDVKGLERDVITVQQRFEDEGYGFLTVALPALDAALVRGLSSGKFTCPTGFKKLRRGVIPRLFSGILCEIFDPFSGLLKEPPDFGVIKDLRTILMFFKKTQLTPEGEDILHNKAVNEFYQCDVVASQVVIPDRHNHLIGRVCKLLLNNLNSKDVENAKYKHGPGAVKEGYKANEKYIALYDDLWREEVRLSEYGLWFPGANQGADAVSVYGDRKPSEAIQSFQYNKPVKERVRRKAGSSRPSRICLARGDRDVLRRVGVTNFDEASRSSAKLISVPKNSTSRRTITVEPMLNQYLQQGLNTLLRDSISQCKVLSNCIALTDQSKNQVLALEGSLHDNWATIDLKSASDLLSVPLVKSVFRHQERFLAFMMDCRSPYVICKGKPLLILGKFAGMGNALTFPVQSVCFAVVCIAAILDSQGKTPTYWNVKRASRCIRVYGDDIIIRSEYAHQCVNWLEEVGLKINLKKSFLSGNFKESCGVDAFRGVDITPLYIKHRPDQTTSVSPNVIAGFVSLSNSLWMGGLYKASAWLQNAVEDFVGTKLPLVSRNSGALGWNTRLDAMTAHKWCRRTHRFLTRTLALTSIKRSDKLDGYPALYKCLSLAQEDQSLNSDGLQKDRSKVQRSLFPEPKALDKDHLDSTDKRYTNRLSRKWVPTLVGTV